MNRARQEELWFWIRLSLAYLGLGLVSAVFAVWVSYPFSGWVRDLIRVLLFCAGFILIEVRVEKTPHGEEDP